MLEDMLEDRLEDMLEHTQNNSRFLGWPQLSCFTELDPQITVCDSSIHSSLCTLLAADGWHRRVGGKVLVWNE